MLSCAENKVGNPFVKVLALGKVGEGSILVCDCWSVSHRAVRNPNAAEVSLLTEFQKLTFCIRGFLAIASLMFHFSGEITSEASAEAQTWFLFPYCDMCLVQIRTDSQWWQPCVYFKTHSLDHLPTECCVLSNLTLSSWSYWGSPTLMKPQEFPILRGRRESRKTDITYNTHFFPTCAYRVQQSWVVSSGHFQAEDC